MRKVELRHDRLSAEVWEVVGDVAWRVGDMARAAGMFRKAHELDTENPIYLARLSAALAVSGRIADARASAGAAVALDSKDASVLETLGVALTKTGDFDRAVGLLEQAAEISPMRTTVLMNLALAKQYLGDFQGAESACRQVIALNPHDESAHLMLVESGPQTKEKNQIPGLEALFTKVEANSAKSLTVGHALAKYFEDLGDYPMALHWLKKGRLRGDGRPRTIRPPISHFSRRRADL